MTADHHCLVAAPAAPTPHPATHRRIEEVLIMNG